jgi:hypothetical protein
MMIEPGILSGVLALILMFVIALNYIRFEREKIDLLHALRFDVENNPEAIRLLKAMQAQPTETRVNTVREKIREITATWSTEHRAIIWRELDSASFNELITIFLELLPTKTDEVASSHELDTSSLEPEDQTLSILEEQTDNDEEGKTIRRQR